jgi:beta-N-acetylhexosaminidase
MISDRGDRIGVIGFFFAQLLLVALLLPLTLVWREPAFADFRYPLFAGLLVLPAAVAAAELTIFLKWGAKLPHARALSFAVLALAFVDVISTLTVEVRFRWIRSQVLLAEPDELAILGQHIIVGFRSRPELQELIARRAVAGVFLTSRNVQDLDSSGLAAAIAMLQNMRHQQGLPVLWIATDQEGGSVSRLSPPLTRLPFLSEIVARHPDPKERAAAVRQLAHTQGRELAEIGVNLNFAPVIDLNHGLINPSDHYTRVYQRAIAADPQTVLEVAGDYCAALMDTGVRCTLKHFPGLGRVFEDTHRGSADLTTPASELAATDWVPFRALMDRNAFIMLGHVRLTSIDPDRPASISTAVVSDLLRRDWDYHGALITDDFGMAAIYHGRDGIERAAVEALNAGVDMILVSFDPDQYYAVMHALLDAYHDGRLRKDILQESARRLASIQAGNS